jgi:hypothetical protein
MSLIICTGIILEAPCVFNLSRGRRHKSRQKENSSNDQRRRQKHATTGKPWHAHKNLAF